MATLKGSASYIWFESDVLGQGATGAVYKARHKRSGELYAVKTFNHMSHMRPMDVQMREFQVMQKINHKNIVKLLGIEEDSLNQNKVLIMELCTGGSLYNLLEEPQNSYGLGEKDFFSVMGDVASGLKHLRELGIVHRDIKPGNILLYNSEDGRHIFKLTDFGAARELEDEEQFMSLYGTEEYLFPDMYARAVLRRPSDRQFDASIDLWSLGVTLYHVGTGHLPFRPFGGRSNKHTMYQMTSNKEPGVVSGVQHEAGGLIEYGRELPETCCLSKGAKLLVTPLLAGLMESKVDRMWTYDKFFQEVDQILKKKKIHVFNAYDGNLLHVFMDPNDKYIQFQDAIAKQTDIPANQQELVLDRGNLMDNVRPMLEVRKYPVTSPIAPMFLYYKCDSSEPWEFPPFQQAEIPKAPINLSQPINLQGDYLQAKNSTGILHYIKRRMDLHHQQQRLLSMAAKVYLFMLCTDVCRLQTFLSQFGVLVEETQKRVKWFRVQHDRNTSMLSRLLDGTSTQSRLVADFQQEGERFFRSNAAKLQEVSEGCEMETCSIDNLHSRLVKGNELECDDITNQQCEEANVCKAKIEVLLEEFVLIVKAFRNDKKKRTGTLTHNEEQIHKFERHKVKSNSDKGSQAFNNGCLSNSKTVFKRFTEWFKWATDVRHNLHATEETITRLTELQANVSQDMDVRQSQHLDKLERILSGHGQVIDSNGTGDFIQDFVVYNKEDAPVGPDGVELQIEGRDQSRRHLVQVEAGDQSRVLHSQMEAGDQSRVLHSQMEAGDQSRAPPSVVVLNRQLASLKLDAGDIKQCLDENTDLLQETLRLMMEDT